MLPSKQAPRQMCQHLLASKHAKRAGKQVGESDDPRPAQAAKALAQRTRVAIKAGTLRIQIPAAVSRQAVNMAGCRHCGHEGGQHALKCTWAWYRDARQLAQHKYRKPDATNIA